VGRVIGRRALDSPDHYSRYPVLGISGSRNPVLRRATESPKESLLERWIRRIRVLTGLEVWCIRLRGREAPEVNMESRDARL